ncbi:DUF5810 domain-containing protein [Haloarchaeobius sp. HRN-SO-5]|uniref:DUF5810 domain-containing protein n=1 Tax=Haloarchaeobius sp. HRN-SO-5 TaxID=3446118 RepID=UPI003EBEB13C
MGYACPVCSVPHADAEHLANHLAFTAMLHGDEHEAWLNEYAPGWESSNPAELGPTVAAAVPETEFEQVFDDTAGGHDHDQQRFEDAVAEQASHRGRGASTATGHEDVLEEARELTRQMHEEAERSGESEDGEAASDTENE